MYLLPFIYLRTKFQKTKNWNVCWWVGQTILISDWSSETIVPSDWSFRTIAISDWSQAFRPSSKAGLTIMFDQNGPRFVPVVFYYYNSFVNKLA